MAELKMTDFKRKYFSRNNFFFNYAASIFELAAESTLLLIITVGLNALLLYLIKMCWGVPLTFIVSGYFYRWPLYSVDNWGAAYILYFAPTLCVYAQCFKISERLLPEFGAVIFAIIKSMRFIVDYVRSSANNKPIPVAGMNACVRSE